MTTMAPRTDRLPAASDAGPGSRGNRPAESGDVVPLDTLRGPVRLGDHEPADAGVEESLLQSSQRPIIRLLIVEDDEEDYDLTEELLARAPETRFDVVWANSVEAGLRQIATDRFDACLVDYRLAGRTGLEFAEIAIRRGFKRPIILVTGVGDPELERAALEIGIADYLDKDEFDTGRLDRCIRFAINRSRNTRRIDPPAATDRLTGVANRTLFLDRVRQALASARRHRLGAGVIALDLDGFRAINERLGHDAGDRLLGIIAERLGHRLRETDTIARFDADSFAVLIENLQRPEDAALVVQKLMEVIEAPTALAGEVLRPTASFGVALYPIDASAADELLRLAEVAMHRAKQAGGRACRFHDMSLSAVSGRITPALAGRMVEPAPKGGLDLALQEQRFELHFQPQVTLRSPVVGLAARPRLRDPERGVLGPDRFLGMVEGPQFLPRLTDWMIEAGAAELAAIRAAGCRVDHLAIPVLQQPAEGWVETADRALVALGKHALEPASLELEFDESTLYDDRTSGLGTIDQLRKRGIRVAVRGYGDAMLSLTLLRDQEIETLKLAQSLLEGVPGDRHRTLFADAVIQLGRHLGVRLVAEEVPGNSQLQMLKRAGCDAAECLMSDPPMTKDDITPWLLRQQRRRESLL